MTSTVIPLTHSVDKALIARLFMRFKGRYGNLWSSRASNHDEWEFIMDDWFDELGKFSLEQVRSAVNKALSLYKEFPPTLGQLIDLCLKESGVPDVKEVVRLMVARDFSHPLVKMVYDKIGGWALTNGKEEDVQRKAKEAYNYALADFTQTPHECWEKLTAFNNQPKALPEPPKIPSTEERKGFKERMAEYQKKIDEAKLNVQGKTYKEFEPNAISPKHKDFDQAIYNEYREYLLSIPDTETMRLPTQYIYERMRFIGQKEQAETLKKAGYVPPKERPQDESPISSNKRNGGPTKVYKSWTND